MKALKDPRVLGGLAGVVVVAVLIALFWGRMFGPSGVPSATHINVLTGERYSWSHDRYQDYYVQEYAKTGRREVFPLEKTEDGGLRIHGHYRGEFVEDLKGLGLDLTEVAKVLDLDTLRVIDE